jgi:hypothetical protein
VAARIKPQGLDSSASYTFAGLSGEQNSTKYSGRQMMERGLSITGQDGAAAAYTVRVSYKAEEPK